MKQEKDNLECWEIDRKLMGRRIRSARLEKGYTQDKLAEYCNCNPCHISNLERGTIGTSLTKLYAISVVLEKDLDYFVTGFPGEKTLQQDCKEIAEEMKQLDPRSIPVVKQFVKTMLSYQNESSTGVHKK
jgi:transcriptional regulator with XRE-family HTH domain